MNRLMLHVFSGDPWGPCAKCDHSMGHEIHAMDQTELDEMQRRREEMESDERTIFGGRGGKGNVTFGGEGSPFEDAQGRGLAERMMASVEAQQDVTSEVVESIGFTQDGRTAEGDLMLSEMIIRFQSGAWLMVRPGSDKTFVVRTHHPRQGL